MSTSNYLTLGQREEAKSQDALGQAFTSGGLNAYLAALNASSPAPSTPAPSTPASSTPASSTPAPVVPPGYFEQEAQRQRDQAVMQEQARGNAASQQAISTGTPLNYTPAPVDLDAISVQQPASLAATSTSAPTWSTQQIADAGTFIAKNLSDPAKIEAKRKEIEQATGRDISVSDILAASKAANLSVSGALADIWSGDKYGPMTTQDYYNWINQGVMERPEFSGQEAQAAMKRFGISGEDITRARALDPRFSAGAQFALTTPTYEESGKTGFAALNQKLRDYIQQNAGAIKPEQARERLTQMLAAGTLTGGQALNEYDVQRATGKTLDELFKEATKPKPFVPPPPINIPAAPSRPVNKIDVPGIDTAFRESPVRTFNPATGTFQYTNPTKLTPATGSGTTWVPPVITSRQRQLLNVGFRDDITTPTYDAVSNMLYQPAASSSQRFAADRSAQMRALQQLRTSVPMGSSTFLQLQSRLRSGEFGGVGGRPVDAAALEAAAKGYAAPTTKIATIGDKYFEKYPDVAETYAKLDAATKAQFRTPSDYAQYHYDTYGRAEGREMPTLFAHGGSVVKKQSGGDVSRETASPNTAEVPQLDAEGRLIDEREEIRSESQRMLNRLQSQPSKLPPGIRRTVAATREQGKESMFPAAAPARDLLSGILGASPTAPGSEAYRTGQAIANMPPVQAAAAIPAKIAASAGDAATALAAMGPAMGAVVKRKGGNWLANAISDEMQNLKLDRFGNDPVDIYEGMRSVYTPEAMSRLSPETLQQVKEGFAALKPQVAINKWIDTKLAKYMQNEFATPEDPIRALIERGISPARNPGDINPIYDYNNVFEKRKKAGFPVEGLAETEAGRNWEEMADSSVNVSSLKDLLSSLKDRQESKYGMIRNEANRTLRDNPWLNKLTLPDTPIYGQLGANYRPVFNHVIDELQNAMATNSGLPKNLQLDPDDLSKMNVPQVVELVDKINKWRVDNIKNLQLEETLKADLYKAYPEQKYRWVQLNRPGQFAAESDAMGHSVRGYEPPDKGGSDYYGLGGFKAIQSGEAKVYSLRDEKGQPHVTIEVSAAPGAMSPSEFYHSDLATQSLFDRLDKVDEATINRDKSSWWEEVVRESPEYQEYLKTIPSKVTQIKGKGNEAPAEKYWAFAQDFVKSGNWSDVQDLRNIGLRKTSNVFNETDIAKLKAMGEDVPNYVSGRDILRLQDLVIPEGMRLKYDNAGNIIGRQNPDYFGFKDGGEVNVPRETSTSKQQLDKLAQVSQRKKA